MTEENFIRAYKNAVPEELCDDLVNLFNQLEESKLVFGRQSNDKDDVKLRSDTYIFLDKSDMGIRTAGERHLGIEFLTSIDQYVSSYCEEFSLAKTESDRLTLESIKMQKIRPGQGYHVWHHEHGPGPCSPRVLAFIFYCNTLTEGGETEFLFQRKRFKPEKNTLMIWPAAFTHTHRGGLVLGEEAKYILTGWMRYNN